MALQTRRDRREKQKQRQKQRQRQAPSSRMNELVTGVVAVGALLLAILGLRAAGVFEPPPAALDLSDSRFQVTSGQTIGTLEPDMGNPHIPVGQPGHYNTEPPTSGEHWLSSAPAAPAPWGSKDAWLPREVTTHNLEHSGSVVQAKHVCAPDVAQLD